jgi:hypothetical protein
MFEVTDITVKKGLTVVLSDSITVTLIDKIFCYV